jgi:hypothetical protein
MAGTIFYRERRKIEKKEKKPRFNLVAVTGVEIDFYSKHLRKKELEEIAQVLDAELVLLKSDPDGDKVEIEK